MKFTNLDNNLVYNMEIVYKSYDYFSFCVSLKEP